MFGPIGEADEEAEEVRQYPSRHLVVTHLLHNLAHFAILEPLSEPYVRFHRDVGRVLATLVYFLILPAKLCFTSWYHDRP